MRYEIPIIVLLLALFISGVSRTIPERVRTSTHLPLFIVCLVAATMAAAQVRVLQAALSQTTTSTFSLFSLSLSCPTSDAEGYLASALALIRGEGLIEYGTHKPLFPILLSALVRFAEGDIVFVHWMLTALQVCSSVLLVLSVGGVAGIVGAFLTASLLYYFFVANIGGILMSESLGFTLGNLAGTLLLHGFKNGRILWMVLGILMQSCALGARTGPMFVLPALVVGCTLELKRTKGHYIGFLVIAVLASSTGFVLSKLSVNLLFDGHIQPFWNFSQTFYGLATGGKSWIQAAADFPELAGQPQDVVSRHVFEASVHLILDSPLPLFKGLLDSLATFTVGGALFFFLPGEYSRLIMTILFVSASLWTLSPYSRSTFPGRLTVLAFVISLAFLLDGGYRARIIASGFWVVPLIIGEVIGKLQQDLRLPLLPASISPRLLAASATILGGIWALIFTFGLFTATRALTAIPPYSTRFSEQCTTACPQNSIRVVLSEESIVRGDSRSATHAEHLREGRAITPNIAEAFRTAGARILCGIDICSMKFVRAQELSSTPVGVDTLSPNEPLTSHSVYSASTESPAHVVSLCVPVTINHLL